MLASFAMAVSAAENVTIYYSWTAADVAANFHRSIADEANKIQTKYNFIFDVKPGAGGSIAANHILNTAPETGILANSSAFFIRPNFFPVTESHDIGKFKELLPVCSAPIVISSKKYKTWAEVPKDKPLTVGMSGMGTTTHLVSTQIAKNYPLMTIVPFKSTSEALMATLSDSTDFAINFFGDSAQYQTGKNRVYVLGSTGDKTINGVLPLAKQGFAKDLALMNSPAQLLVPASIPDETFNAWRKILVQAARSERVQNTYKPDSCVSIDQMPDAEIQKFYQTQTDNWKRLTNGVLLK